MVIPSTTYLQCILTYLIIACANVVPAVCVHVCARRYVHTCANFIYVFHSGTDFHDKVLRMEVLLVHQEESCLVNRNVRWFFHMYVGHAMLGAVTRCL